ncbi:hypothetical protein Dimus_038880 [Dionaea muscipula]
MLDQRSLRSDLIELNHNLRTRTKKQNPQAEQMAGLQNNVNNQNSQNNGVNGDQHANNAQNAKNDGGNNGVAQPLHAHFIPNVYDTPSCIVHPAINAANYEIKPGTIQSLPTFNGLSQEDPYIHLSEFSSISSTLRINNFPIDVMKLILFPFSLRGQAKQWLNTRPPNSIRSWEEMSVAFLKKYFSVGKTL